VQVCTITNKLAHLCYSFALGAESGVFDDESPEYVTLPTCRADLLTTPDSYPGQIRFFAHLCLFMQLIGEPLPPTTTQRIVEKYLQVLEVSLLSPLLYVLVLIWRDSGRRSARLHRHVRRRARR
jgi:nuclear pore complex protein Nup107